MTEALLYAAAPTLAIPLGAAVVVRRPPGPALRSALQHFAAGALNAVVAVELLGEIDDKSPIAVAVGIALGTAFMTALDVTARRLERRGGRWRSAGLLATVTVDFLLDGLLWAFPWSSPRNSRCSWRSRSPSRISSRACPSPPRYRHMSDAVVSLS